MKKLIKASIYRGNIVGNVPAYWVDVVLRNCDVDLPSFYDPNKSVTDYMLKDGKLNWEEFTQLEEIAGDYLVSNGFDTYSKIDALDYLEDSGVDVISILKTGWNSSLRDLRALGRDKRLKDDTELLEQIENEFSEYYDESENAYVFDTGDPKTSKELVESLINAFKRMNHAPSYYKKFITPGKYYKVFMH